MRWWLSIGFGIGAGIVPALGQCALCRSAVETGDSVFAAALRSGILLLLVMPYLLAGVIAVVLWRTRRRRRMLTVAGIPPERLQ
jgi:hypothetical protein